MQFPAQNVAAELLVFYILSLFNLSEATSGYNMSQIIIFLLLRMNSYWVIRVKERASRMASMYTQISVQSNDKETQCGYSCWTCSHQHCKLM